MERTEPVGTLTWLTHGCFVGTDGVCLDVNMVGTRMLFVGTDGVYLDVNMVGTRMIFVGTDGVCLDVNMVATWMLCGNGHRLCGP